MKNINILIFTTTIISSIVFGQSEPIKKSNSGICHKPSSQYYKQTKNFVPYTTLDECLKSGGRLPKK
jgi:hypothetical protein